MDNSTNTLQLRNGNTLGYAEFGDKHGLPVLYFHGLPGSRSEGLLWHQNAITSQVRLIAPDRPGMGLSTRDANRQLVSYAKDITELLEHLGIYEVRILGVSGGGPYALACAADPDLAPKLQGVAVVAGLPSPELSRAGMSLIQRFGYFAINIVPAGVVGWIWDQLIGKTARNPDPQALRKAVKQSIVAQGGEDAKLADRDEVIEGMTESLRGAFVQGSQGYVDDAAIVSRAWGFKLDSITVPVGFWCGGKDTLSPPRAGEMMAAAVPKASRKFYDDDSHSGVVCNHQEEVLAQLCNSRSQ